MASQEYDQVIVDIKNYVYHYEITSAKAWKNARVALLDALGCAIETVFKSEDCKRMFGPVVPNSIIPNGFRLPGTSYILDPLKGSFDMGTAIRYLDHNDAIAGADWGHPSDNLGSILAVSDWLCRSSKAGVIKHKGPPLTLKTLLVVLIKAYEIQGCMLLCNAFNMYGLDHVVLVKLASTAVVSWLLGLTEDQTLAAISQVWMDGHALRVYRQKGNTIPRKGWAAGDACMKATQLALLTRDGQPGSPTPLSMPRWGFYANCFGNKRFELPKDYDSWVIENIIFKVMAVEGHGIASVEAALRQVEVLRSRNLNAETDITRIIIRTNAATDMIINKTGKLNNPADRDHCLQHLVALTFLKGKLPEAEDFLDGSSWSRSSEMDILRGKIEISVDEQFTRDYMDLNIKSVASGLAVECSNGLRLDEIVIHFPIGHGKNPKTLEVIKEKFHQNMGLMFSKDEVDEILALVNNEGAEEKPVSELLDLLVRESDISPKL